MIISYYWIREEDDHDQIIHSWREMYCTSIASTFVPDTVGLITSPSSQVVDGYSPPQKFARASPASIVDLASATRGSAEISS